MKVIERGTILNVVPNSTYVNYNFSKFKKAKFISFSGDESYYIEVFEGSVEYRSGTIWNVGQRLYFPKRFFTIDDQEDNYEIY